MTDKQIAGSIIHALLANLVHLRIVDNQVQDYERFTRDRFKERHILEVVYEKLTTKPREIFQYIGGYLGIDDIDPSKITLTKQNPESLEQLIVNYDQVYEVLKNTKYAPHLNCSI